MTTTSLPMLAPLQNEPEVQPPQLSCAAHPSESVPQSAPADMQVAGMQVPAPQTFATPAPPQLSPVPQVPQLSVPPQPSDTWPQFFRSAVQVVGRQVVGVTHAPREQPWPRPQLLQAPPNWPQAVGAEPP